MGPLVGLAVGGRFGAVVGVGPVTPAVNVTVLVIAMVAWSLAQPAQIVTAPDAGMVNRTPARLLERRLSTQ